MLTATELAHFTQTIAPAAAHARRVNLMAEKTDPETTPAPVAPAQPKEEKAMPKGVYNRKAKSPDAPKKRKADTPPVAKKARGQYAGVLAELREKRASIDAAIEAIEALA